VANPKELDAMTREAAQFRSLISPREDRLLELYEQIESEEAQQLSASEQLRSAREHEASRQARLHGEKEQLQVAVEDNTKRRGELLPQIDDQSVRSYESLRRSRAGIAVAEVAQRTCQACRVSLPVNVEERARSGQELVYCQSCARILYAGH
jgi:predicted  nucleic acid-binding Zn-ribbon protein